MPLPNKTELSLAPNNLTMKNLMEKQRDSIQGSGKAYSSTTTYEKYDTSIYDEIEYISIYSDGNTQHTNQQPDVSPTYWQDKRVFDNVVETSSLSTTLEDYYTKTENDNLLDDKVSKVTSTDNAIVKFNGVTGEIQDTGVLIDNNDFITTQIFNQDGTEFDGVEYFDAGLLGVPDTTFSPTGARIYPDGTIRGKSSYGEYVKYPDGRLECKYILPKEGFMVSTNLSVIIQGINYYRSATPRWYFCIIPNSITNTHFSITSLDFGSVSPQPVWGKSAYVSDGITIQLHGLYGWDSGGLDYERLASVSVSISGTWK